MFISWIRINVWLLRLTMMMMPLLHHRGSDGNGAVATGPSRPRCRRRRRPKEKCYKQPSRLTVLCEAVAELCWSYI